MEGRNRSSSSSSSPSSIVDALFGSKNDDSTTPSVMGDSLKADLYATLNKHRNVGHVQTTATGDRYQGTQITYSKDGKPIYPNLPAESACFGSSLHYGGRDFYASSTLGRTSETLKKHKNDEEDDNTNKSNIVTSPRGEWWQGSYYY